MMVPALTWSDGERRKDGEFQVGIGFADQDWARRAITAGLSTLFVTRNKWCELGPESDVPGIQKTTNNQIKHPTASLRRREASRPD
jgi:hypothetical protein